MMSDLWGLMKKNNLPCFKFKWAASHTAPWGLPSVALERDTAGGE